MNFIKINASWNIYIVPEINAWARGQKNEG